MKAVLLEVPQEMLDERRRLGLDGRDEMWDGVLHVVPPAGGPHQRLSTKMVMVLGPLAEARGLVPQRETGLFRDDHDYRVPDQLYCRPEHTSDRGAEVFRALGDTGRLLPVQAAPDGSLASEVLGVHLHRGDGVLHLSWDGGAAEL